MTNTHVPDDIAAFLYLEARYADESRYDDWESLWADDAIYWLPTKDDSDPSVDVSYIYDNRSRIHSRLAQLKTGRRYSQSPPSKMRRMLSNLEVLSEQGDDIIIGANFVLYEHRNGTHVWAGRYLYTVRRTADGLQLVKKTALLVNNEDAIRTVAFII